MRELYLVDNESTETFYVLRDNDGVRYQIARSEIEPVADMTPERTVFEQTESRSSTLPLRPKDIQARIRAGATPEDLAEEMGVDEQRIEPYAHPVILERFEVAETAKQSHPVRDDGPAKQTLFEVLATALAARGHSLSDAKWDATREPGDDWVVHLRWTAGLSETEAIWSLKRSMGTAPTTEARNSVAADLIDPNFNQPVRSLTAVETPAEVETDPEPMPDEEEGSVIEGDFLRHPDEEERPQQRRRKAVTPHWEDVLLGVRTNTKRPRK